MVIAHDDHFAPDTTDVEWISACGENNWVIVSSDKAIKKNLLEKQAILSSEAAAFFFTSTSITSDQQISAFTLALPQDCKPYLKSTETLYRSHIPRRHG